MKFLIFFVLLAISQPAFAIGIRDSSTSDRSAFSMQASLNRLRSITTAGYQNAMGVPVGTIIGWPAQVPMNSYDAFKYLECNGQIITERAYPELYAVLGGTGGSVALPNFDDRFLKGTTVAANTLTSYEDSLKSHTLYVNDHTHEFNKYLASPALTGSLDSRHLTGNLQTRQLVNGKVDNPGVNGQLTDPSMAVMSQAITKDSRNTGWDVNATYSGKATNSRHDIPDHTHYFDLSYRDNNLGYDSEGYGDLVYSGNSSSYVTSKSGTFETVSLGNVDYDIDFSGNTNALNVTVNMPTRSISSRLTNNQFTAKLANDDVVGALQDDTVTGDLLNSAVTGNLNNDKVTGQIDERKNLLSRYNGRYYDALTRKYRDETAPKHMLIRYFIKAIP